MDVADLFVALKVSNQPVLVVGFIIVIAWTNQIHTDHEPGIHYQILLFWVVETHISYVYAPSLSFDILDKWNINNQ
jgi:hypothetical protein